MRFTIERTIAAPRAEAYRALTDIASWPGRIEQITRVEPAEPGGSLEFRDGARFRETRVMFGKEAVETMTVRDVAPERSWVLAATSHGAAHRYGYHLDDTPDGHTRVTLTGDITGETLVAKVVWGLTAPLFKRGMIKCMHKDLDDIERSLAPGVGA